MNTKPHLQLASAEIIGQTSAISNQRGTIEKIINDTVAVPITNKYNSLITQLVRAVEHKDVCSYPEEIRFRCEQCRNIEQLIKDLTFL